MAVSYQNKNHWYLFILFPFLAGILAVKNYHCTWAKNVIWAFVVFFGFTFGMSEETSSGNATADITRYAQEVKDLYKKDLSFAQIVNLYQDNEDIDVLKLTLAIGISRFTDNQQVLTAIYGFIFGFFFSRNFWFVLNRINGKIKTAAMLLLIAYVLVDPIWNINGFRFHTAVQIFIYGLLPFLFEGKKKGILASALSILVHFSFLLPVGVLLVYVLLGNRTILYFVFFLASVFSTGLNVSSVNNLVEDNAPEAFSERTAGYRDEGVVEEFRADPETKGGFVSNWYATLYLKALQWPLMVLLTMLFIKRKNIQLNQYWFTNSLSFTLLFFGVANLMASFPSGGRFLAVAALSALPLMIFYVQNLPGEKYLSNKVLLFSPAILLFIIVTIRAGFYSLSVNTFIGNPLVVLLTDYNISLNDLIK